MEAMMIPELEEIWKMLKANECTLAEAWRWIERHIEMAREEAEQDQRDWFAGQALSNPVICTGKDDERKLSAWFGRDACGITREQIASAQAYAYADAMLKERDR